MIPNVLSIAGTDPSGGAGIHADLKTFAACAAYGMAVVTSVVSQTTTGVTGVMPIPAAVVRSQLETLLDDVRVDAVKIGLLGDPDVVETVAWAIERWALPYVVLDPVMVAKSGDRLLPADAVAALRRLLEHVDLVTPNVAEAAALLEVDEAADGEQQQVQARALLGLGPGRVLLKGGHLGGPDSRDVLAGDGHLEVLSAPRIATVNDHGTGCTLSSAIAALRPQRQDWPSAVRDAKAYLTGALAASDRLEVGHGRGPLNHFWATWG